MLSPAAEARWVRCLFFSMTLISLASLDALGQEDRLSLTNDLNSASAVLKEIMAVPGKGIPQGVLAGAKCVTVIPANKKGTFVVGAQYGRGVAK